MKSLGPKQDRNTDRILTQEERDLWRRVARTVARRIDRHLAPISRLDPPAILKDPVAPTTSPMSAMIREPFASQLAIQKSAPAIIPFDRRQLNQIARGKLALERVLDLHGMRQHEAHEAMCEFIHSAIASDIRLVLVITGKGRLAAGAGPADDHDRPGILRRQVPHWLKGSRLRNLVLGFAEASPGHGGAGALYIRLRKRRDTKV